MRTHHWWPIGRGRRQGLNTRLLVIVTSQLPTGFAPVIFIDDLDLLVHVQHVGHFELEVRIPLLHVVSDLVRPQFALPQDLVEFGSAQFEQRRMAGCDTALVYVASNRRYVHNS